MCLSLRLCEFDPPLTQLPSDSLWVLLRPDFEEGQSKKTCFWRPAVPTCSGMLLTSRSGTGSGHSFDAMPLWWHGNHWMGAVFISSLACGRLVHPSTAQPRGSKIASSNGTDIDLRFYKAWSTLCRSLFYQGVILPGFLSFIFKQLEPLLLSVLSVSSFSVSYLGWITQTRTSEYNIFKRQKA